jgi:arylsulfatase A-like enzyme
MPDLTPTGVSYRTSLIAPPGGTYAFDVALPPRGELMLATGLEQSTTAEPVRFIAKVDGAVVLDEVVKDIRWRDHRIALPDEPGRKVRIELRSEGQTAQRGLWANPRVLTRSPDAPSILFITLDAVRPDHLSAYGYPRDTSPALAHIASSGARFDKVVAQSASTWQSVLSLLSGRHPIRSGVRQAGDRLPPNVPLLPDLLAARGYDTFAGSDNAAFPAGQIARFDEEEINVVGNSNDLAAVTEREMRMMAKRMAERPTFAWFHIENAHYPLLPAQPLRYDPGYEGRFKLGFSLDEHWTFHSAAKVTPAEQKHIVALYDAGIRDADDLVKQMILLLDEVHATENTILVITADHGEHLGERDLTLEHSSPWEQVLRVPLIIAWLGHLPAGVVVSQRAQLIDLVPTLLGLAGLPPAADLDGRDLSPLLRGEKLPEAPAYSEPEKAIYVQYRGDEKLILNPGGAGLRFGEQIIAVPPRELYDLASDPQEARDLVPLDPKRAADAEAALLAAIKRLKDRGEGMHGAAPGQAAFTTLQQAGYLHLSQPPAVAGKVER